jgi:hypothetical protein
VRLAFAEGINAFSVTPPPPFDQVPSPPGHEIHDKLVVCGLNGQDPVVYCGSSNLASGGEAANGDSLLAIHDADVATAFAIEGPGLVDHYNFLDRMADPKKAAPKKKTRRLPVRRKLRPRRKRHAGALIPFSAKRSAYCPRPSFSAN